MNDAGSAPAHTVQFDSSAAAHDLQTALSAWDLGRVTSVTPHGRGMNSATWLIVADNGHWVAKAVPARAAAQFDAGLLVARRLEAAGLSAGAPRLTRHGAPSVAMAGRQLAILRFVAGRTLNPRDPRELRRWGATLGRAHGILCGSEPPPGLQRWHWVEPDAPHLNVEPWVRDAVRVVVARLHALQQDVPFTHGVLHADPAPEAFLVDERGRAALIDWGSAVCGPLLYDVASARLYAGAETDFSAWLDGYLAAMPLAPRELDTLPTFLQFRWAVQADYFARRIWHHDLTGIDDPAENAQGLADARRALIGA
jgi:homoserine kinase type II